MSTVVVITPLVIANWAAISAAAIAVASKLEYDLVRAGAERKVRARRLARGQNVRDADQSASASVNPSAASLVPADDRAEIDLAQSEIMPAAPGVAETLVIERDGVRATFSRDERGALKLCIVGPHLSKAELLAIGEDLMGRVTQQYAYHRIMSELKERQAAIVGEEVSPDQSVKIRVRNF